MNTGQMIMPIPLGATLAVAVPVSPTALPAQTGEQEGNAFAGVLSEMASLGVARLNVAKATIKAADAPISVGNEMMVAALSLNVMPDAVTAIQQPVGNDGQTASISSDAAVSEDVSTASPDRVQPEALMSQNVAQCAAGAQIVQAPQFAGRMPESDAMGISQPCDGAGSATIYPASTQTSQMQVPVPQTDNLGKIHMVTEPAVISEQITAKSDTDVHTEIQPRSGQMFGSAAVTTEVPVQQAQPAVPPTENHVEMLLPKAPPAELAHRSVVTASQQVETAPSQRSTAGMGQAAAVPVQLDVSTAVQSPSGQLFRSTVVTAETPVRQPQLSVTPVEKVAGLQVLETSMADMALRSVATEPQQVEIASPPRSTVDVVQAATLVENPEESVENGTQVVELKNIVRPDTSKQKTAEITTLDSRDEANLLADRDANPDTALVKLEKGHTALQSAGFKFSRAVDVEAALGSGHYISGRVAEKTTAGSDTSMKVDVGQQLKIESGADISGSDAGSAEQGSEGFAQQSPEAFRALTQHLSGINQKFSLDATSPVEGRIVPSEPSRSENHENIAGQVRDRLSSHDIKTGSEQIVLRLSPEHLGDIKVNLRLENQTLRVEMVAENRMARESLLQHVDSLKEALSRQNISMDKFSVTSGGSDAGSQNGGAQGEWRELAKNRQAQQWMGSGGYRIPVAEAVPLQPQYLARTEHAMLDLHF